MSSDRSKSFQKRQKNEALDYLQRALGDDKTYVGLYVNEQWNNHYFAIINEKTGCPYWCRNERRKRVEDFPRDGWIVGRV